MDKTLIAGASIALGILGWQGAAQSRSPLLLKEEQMFIEYAAHNGETVMIMSAESEVPLGVVEVRNPLGGKVLQLGVATHRGHSVQGFDVETSETTKEKLFQTYAEGLYELRALALDGTPAIGRAVLSHDLLAPTVVTYPVEGAVNVPTTGLTLTWEADTEAAGYQVVLEQDENDGLSVSLPAGTTHFEVPNGYLASGTVTQFEIGAIGYNGNRTLVEVVFTTL